MLVDGNGGGLSAADVGAVLGNSNRGGFGFGGDGAWWLIVLFLFALSGNGWGNGFGGGNATPYVIGNGIGGDVQRGFDQQAVVNGIAGIGNSINNGVSDILQTLNSNQAAMTAGVNTLAMSLQNCCCENRAAVADLKYTVATEACADRTAVSNALRDVLTANTASTQRILDQLCQDKIDAKNEKIADLERQLTMANLAASQTAQTSRILADNANQTLALEQYLNPTPVPAYVVQNPNCCQNTGSSCGCGFVA